MAISLVVNTRNEESHIANCLNSATSYVDEIVIVDMESTDRTVQIAKEFTSRIFQHPNVGYVEPARNFAIQKAAHEWILLLDADEVIPPVLGTSLKKLISDPNYTYYRLPRRNLIFGRWIKFSGWWPDYKIRLFQKNAVKWSDEIHSIPLTTGRGRDLEAKETEAIQHLHYDTITQFLTRMDRYTTIEADARINNDQTFEWKNILASPVQEFLRRYFAWQGYRDGLHGLVLSLLQAVSMLVVELKVWESKKFAEKDSMQVLKEATTLIKSGYKDFLHWRFFIDSENKSFIKRWYFKLRGMFGI